MKLWALRLALFLVAFWPLLVWTVIFVPGLVFAMPLVAAALAIMIVRRFEHWLLGREF